MAKRGPKIADKYMTATPGVDFTADNWEPDYSGVTIVFRNGKQIATRLDELPQSVRVKLECHGLSQKEGDSYAGVMGDMQTAYDNVSEVVALLKRGDWEKEGREPGIRLNDLEEAVNTYRGELGKPAYSHDEFLNAYTGPDGQTKRERAKANARVGAILTSIAQRKLAEKKAELEKAAESATRDDTI